VFTNTPRGGKSIFGLLEFLKIYHNLPQAQNLPGMSKDIDRFGRKRVTLLLILVTQHSLSVEAYPENKLKIETREIILLKFL